LRHLAFGHLESLLNSGVTKGRPEWAQPCSPPNEAAITSPRIGQDLSSRDLSPSKFWLRRYSSTEKIYHLY